MKIIDEKGRLFGKINIIDFLVILFLLFILPMFYIGYKVFTKKPFKNTWVTEEARNRLDIELNCRLIELQPDVLKQINVGDKEVDQNGTTIGEITWVGQSKPYEYKINLGDNRMITKEDPVLKELPVKLKLNSITTGNRLYYKEKRVDLDYGIDFFTPEYKVKAKLIPLDAEQDSELFLMFTDIELSCRFIELRPEVLKQIAVGDKEIDENGTTIGEITWVGQSKPYEYKINLGDDQFITKEDPLLKELQAKLKLSATVRSNNLYYKNKKISSDSLIEFATEKYNAQTLIQDLGEIRPDIRYLNTRNIILNITFKNLSDKEAGLISIADKELDERGDVIAEILQIGQIEPNLYEIDLGQGNFVITEDARNKQVTVKMRIACQVTKGGHLYFKGSKVDERSLIEFNNDKYSVSGKVAKTYSLSVPVLKKKWITISAKFTGMPIELANVVREGDMQKGAEGDIIAKIKKVVSNKASQVLVLRDRDWLTLKHPFNRDTEIILDILCIYKDGEYYFNNYPVKIGNNIGFSTELYSLYGSIFSLEIK